MSGANAETVRLDAFDVAIGNDRPLVAIAGPCVIEDAEGACAIARAATAAAREAGIGYVFKASFDKANRTRRSAVRGPGIDRGLAALAEVRERCRVPVVTDVHEPWQAARAAEVADLLQVPALLCRQTDLLVAAGRTGKPVLIKKGQSVAAEDMAHAADKVRAAGGRPILCERGASLAGRDLVADLRSLIVMRAFAPVAFDATHGVLRPAPGVGPDARRDWVAPLARAAVAAGVAALFLEVHPDPARAPSDGPLALPLSDLPALFGEVAAVDRVVKRARHAEP